MRHPFPLVVMLWLIVVLGCAVPSDRRSNSNSATLNNSPELELLSYRGEQEYSYLIVNGQVKNISGQKMDGVCAVVEFYDSQGTLITSESSVIEYNPLMPGQTSPFKVLQRNNPLIAKFQVKFKYVLGTPISHKDSTATSQPPTSKRKKK